MQPRGAGGPRHFDNLVRELAIPEYDRPLREGAYFTSQRRAIRAALAADGVDARIDALVTRLLD